MQCLQCHAENREGSRFCARCGTPLAAPCPECGFANYPDAKFCGGCGKTLSAPLATESDRKRETPEPERRQLTVLFCDLVGSTGLAERLDPEELHQLLAQYQDACADVIQRYDGYIARYVGDGLLVYFGYPQAHEDDPQRAVRTGLGIVESIKGLDAKFDNPSVNLAVRIGITAGLVVAGDIGSGERREEKAVVGETPNLAARLQGLAEPDAVVIGASTQRLVNGLFECDALGAQALKGISQPVDAYRVQRESSTAKRMETPFVGRRAELSQFAGVLGACRETRHGQAIYVRGEAGIGKTRLVEEFVSIAKKEGFVPHQGLVLDFGIGKGQDAVRSVVRSLLGVARGSDISASKASAERVLTDSLLKPEQRVFLNDLLDLPQSVETRSLYDAMDNATRNRGKREVVIALLMAASARQPVLITVEDVHWADSVTLGHLAAITAAVSDCPAMLLMTSRVEGDPLDQTWRSSIHRSPLMTIDLAPLRQKEAMALANSFVDASSPVAIKCIERAQGNPLFLEQLLRDAEETDEHSVPLSIQSLVLARMDRLPPADKQALQAASVIGQRFSPDTLQSLIDAHDYDCRALVAHYLIRPVEDDFLFAHALIREGVYSSLLKSRRRALHGRAAEWFADRDPTLRAQHLDRAEDPAAPQAYLEAAEAQASDYHYGRAQQLVERGLAIAKDKPDRFALTCLQGELLHDLAEPAKSIEAYRTALELADDDAKQCRAWIGVAAGMRLQDQFSNVLEALEPAEAAARHKDLKEELARIHNLRGGAYFMLSKFEGCREQHEAALDYARKAHSAHAEASALSGLADAEYARGRILTANRRYQECLNLCREHGFGRLEVANLPMVALIRLYRADLGGARDDALAAAEAARRVGHRRAELLAASIVFHVFFELGETGRVKEEAEQLYKLARERGSGNWEQVSLLHWGKALILEGDRSEAIKRLEQAFVVSREIEKTFMGSRILAALALATDDPNARQQALNEGERILQQGSPSHCHFWFYRDAMEASLNTADWDTVDRYAAALAEYTRVEPPPWTDFFIARGRALANYGRGKRDDATIRELQRVRDEAVRVGFKMALPALERALEKG